MTVTYLPIAADDGLFLTSHRHGNEVRFCDLFRQVWTSLPRSDRDAVEAHWGCDEDGRLGVSIALENLSKLRRDEAVGNCESHGMQLKFYARVIDIISDALVRYVIAHELAHVLQTSRGQTLRHEPHALGDYVAYWLSSVEKEADQIALRWGFDGKGLNPWLDQHVKWAALPDDPY